MVIKEKNNSMTKYKILAVRYKKNFIESTVNFTMNK